MPLLHMFPGADIPVLQLSMPRALSDRELFELGRRLAPLREEGVFILGSGNVVHNLYRPRPTDVPSYALRFDDWVASCLTTGDLGSLVDWQSHPDASQSHPTSEHFRPLLVAMGAAAGAAQGPAEGWRVSFPLDGFEHATVSLRCVEFV